MPVHTVDHAETFRSLHHLSPSSNQADLPSFGAQFDHDSTTSQRLSESSSCSPPPQLLPQTTYSSSARATHPNRLTLDTDNATKSQSLREESSPDPRDFYLQYRDPFGYDGAGPIDDTGLTPIPHTKTRPTQLSNGSPTSHRPRQRASSSRPTSSTAAGGSKDPSSPPQSRKLPYAQRVTGERQASLKHLVDKFNQNQDELPPRPSLPTSVSSSRAGSPTSFARSTPRAASSGNYREQFDHGQRLKSPARVLHDHPSTSVVGDSSPGAHSRPPAAATPARKPLFGEIVPSSSPHHPAAQARGRSSVQKRRDSDGSMHSPNPMFVDDLLNAPSSLSPTSPTAWYLGYTPSFNKVNSTSPYLSHRRSRSDMGGKLSPQTGTIRITTTPRPNEPRSPTTPSSTTTTRPKSRSRSRIPISTRRRLSHSDSGGSSPSTRANSSLDRHVALPPKGASALPKPLPPKSHPSSPQAAKNPAKSPARPGVTSPPRDRGNSSTSNAYHQTQKSQSLKAYISAPPPKKSPPLRSSRPRQPVSSATTSASRAKVVDRVSSLNSSSSIPKPDSARPSRQKSRRLPELGNVDFAARRQQIQQAFNKSVKANEKKEERAVRRRQVAKEKEQDLQAQKRQEEQIEIQTPTEDKLPATPAPSLECDDKPVTSFEVPTEDSPELDDEGFVTPDEGPSPRISDSLGNDEIQRGESIRQEAVGPDSPTMGTCLTIPGEPLSVPRPETPESEIEPVSAATVKTTTTIFDSEPQSDVPPPSAENRRTMLSQIMQMRESSPSISSSDDEDDDLSSDREKESIQIMLRQSGYYPDSTETSSDNLEEADEVDYSRYSEDHNRWSLSSWTSSAQDQRPSHRSSVEVRDGFLPQENDDYRDSRSAGETVTTPQPLFATRYDPNEAHAAEKPEAEQTLPQQDPVDGVRMSSYLMEQYPDLVKQAKWDSKRATQLYLQELAKTGFDSARFSMSNHGNVDPKPENQEVSLPHDQNEYSGQHTTDVPAEDSVMVPASRSVPKSDYTQHRASLNLRDDFEQASPSIADWMHLAAGDDVVKNEKDRVELPGDTPEREGAETPRISSAGPGFEPVGQSVEGLGLSIRVESPQDDNGPTIPPPPPPTYSPPPPPIAKGQENLYQPLNPVQMSPSVYSTDPPSSTLPSQPYRQPENVPDTRSSEESSLHHAGPTPSPQTLASSATSQERSSVEQGTVTPAPPAPAPAPARKSSPSPEQRRLNKRSNVIKELVDTEYTFGQDMTVVVDIYKGTSSSCLDLSAEDVKTLFSNSEQIVQFSMDFQDTLKQAAKSVYVLPKSQRWRSKRGSKYVRASNMTAGEGQQREEPEVSDDQNDKETFIGKSFMANIERMEKVYTDYLKNHDAASKTLETLQKSKKVNIWLKECRDWAADLTTAWNLDSLLVKPVQRILKYPLLLTELLSATPTDHPDHAAIANALRETTTISTRINELKKRADVVGQIVGGRKRKESDVRAGLSKAFGRRTEKLKQHVGLTETFTDSDFDAMAQQFGDNFFQLQLIMRDVELYTTEVQSSVNKFNEFVVAIEAYITVAPSNYPELESKWCRFRLAVKDVMTVALVDHLASVRKSVINPMVTLLKLHDGPQRVMQKRNKRLFDYMKFKAAQNRGDKPDKKTKEQGEQFVALNETLKDELPKLVALTGKLMEGCLNSFVQLQTTWQTVVQKRLSYILDRGAPDEISQIINDWSGDFSFSEAQVLSLGICNGSVLADTSNHHNFSSPSISNDPKVSTSSSRHSTMNSRNFPDMTASPKISFDMGTRSSNNFAQSPPVPANSSDSPHLQQYDRPRNSTESRGRTNSSFTGRASNASEMPSMASVMNASSRTSTSTSAGKQPSNSARTSEASPSLPQLSLETPRLHEFLSDPALLANHRGAPPDPTEHPSSPTVAGRYSGFFSSAMPMPENSIPPTPVDPQNHGQSNDEDGGPAVLFLAASMFEFNIDRARREAGYPYLTYVAGEVFDVLGEKGDLWLARNQDDPTRQVGWIWTKHFAKIGGELGAAASN